MHVHVLGDGFQNVFIKFQGGTVTSLQRSSSQSGIVSGFAETSSSSSVPEYVSYPFGSEDAKSKYKRLQQYKVL